MLKLLRQLVTVAIGAKGVGLACKSSYKLTTLSQLSDAGKSPSAALSWVPETTRTAVSIRPVTLLEWARGLLTDVEPSS